MWREKEAHIYSCIPGFVAFFVKIISDSYLRSAASLHELSVEVRTG